MNNATNSQGYIMQQYNQPVVMGQQMISTNNVNMVKNV